MKVRRRLLAALLGTAVSTTAAAETPAPTLSHPTTPESAPAADGFIQRWLLLEPIGAENQPRTPTCTLRKRPGEVP